MKPRLVELLALEAANSAGTKVIDISVNDPITRIIVETKATNNGSVPTAHPAKIITKLEITDGSNIIASLSGYEIQALSAYHTKVPEANFMDYRNDVMNIATFKIDFGRWMWDKLYALDPSKFSNLQIRITHNLAAGGSAPDAMNLGVFAHVFESGAVQPKGFLQSKRLYSYALSNSGLETITLPTDYPYRKLLIMSIAINKMPYQQYNKLTLTIDQDKKVLINNMSVSDLSKILSPTPRMHEMIKGIGTGAGVAHHCTPSYDGHVVVGAITTAIGTAITEEPFGGSVLIQVDSGEHFQAFVEGRMPHGALELPFGNQDEPDSWLNMDDVGSFVAKVTAGGGVESSSTAEIVAQQERLYI